MSHVDRMKSGQSSSTIVVSQVFPTLNQKQNEHIIMLVNERVQQQEQEKLRRGRRVESGNAVQLFDGSSFKTKFGIATLTC